MKKRLIVELIVLAFLGSWLVMAGPANENALHDANAIYSLLADYGSETKRVTADVDGNLNINVQTSTLSSEYVDDADWTDNSSMHQLVGGVYVSPSISPGDTGPIHIDDHGNQYVLGESGSTTLVETILDDYPTSVTSSNFFVGEYKSISFLLDVDITDGGGSPSLVLTVEVSPDSLTWIDYDIILDQNGTDAPQGSITYVIDDEDVFYLPSDFTVQYLHVVFTGVNTDADNTIEVTAWMQWRN